MDIEKIIETVRHFLLVDGWTYFHIKADGESGQRREMFISNLPLKPQQETQTEVLQNSTEEDSTAKITRILNGLKLRQTPQGEDENFWKDLQSKISQNGAKPQIIIEDTVEQALTKAKDAGVI